jgi:hypothetical protein
MIGVVAGEPGIGTIHLMDEIMTGEGIGAAERGYCGLQWTLTAKTVYTSWHHDNADRWCVECVERQNRQVQASTS